jgi:glyoxylase-like metal-dependent hydrolase (beta-lactamase superfamily II)
MPDTHLSRYAFEGVPATAETREVAPGVHWHRMPLPFKLDHINLWLLEDGDGWTAVDTGIARPEVRDAWERIFATRLAGKPLKRVIVTHFHPDHVGLAGWLRERTGAEVWMPLAEWAFARMLTLDQTDATHAAAVEFYRVAGFDAAQLAAANGRRGRYAQSVSPIPLAIRRYREGETIMVGGRGWRVIVGLGHSPEHACLWCGELKVLISGDQILPRISPNIAVWPHEPDANPLALYLESLGKFRGLPDDTLVLPSHDRPFRGLAWRLDELADHHRSRLQRTWDACAAPASGTDVLRNLFARELDSHQLMFAIGEALAHVHWLASEGALTRESRADGVRLFRQAAKPF